MESNERDIVVRLPSLSACLTTLGALIALSGWGIMPEVLLNFSGFGVLSALPLRVPLWAAGTALIIAGAYLEPPASQP